jgi:CRISPR type I-E-associated protein CasB/Cse2
VAKSEYPLTGAQVLRRDFIDSVIRQCRNDHAPEVRAALRAALGKKWDAIPYKTFKHVAGAGLPESGDTDFLHAHYAVAAMIAAVPRSVGLRAAAEGRGARRPDLGWSLAKAVDHPAVGLTHGAAEGHLELLVKQSANGLHRHLPPVVGRLSERPGVLDWECLLADLSSWHRDSDRISRAWLRSFYAVREKSARDAALDVEGGQANAA